MYQQQQPFQQQVPQQQNPLWQHFAAVDRDRSGQINATELQMALQATGSRFELGVAERMVRMFDRDFSGTLNFDEFCQVHMFIMQMQGGFRQRDRDNSGTLDINEVRAALAASGFQLQDQVFFQLMKQFDPQRRGLLTLDGYIELSILLSTARNVFAYHDRNRNNQVMMNFDMFLGAVVATR